MAEIEWAHLVNGDFADGANWKGGVVPGTSDDAILESGGAPYTVTSSAFEEVNSIQLAASATLAITGEATLWTTNGTGSGANDGSILVSYGSLIVGGTFDNVGSITLDVGRINTRLAGVTLQGGGDIDFTTGAAIIDGAGLTNVDNTLSGFVQIDVSDLTNDPNGLIIGTGASAGGILPNDNYGAGNINNLGTIAASTSATFSLLYETVDNAGGTILAEDDSSIDLIYDTISGGSIDTIGSGVVFAGTYVDDGFPLGNTYIDGLTSTVYINGTLEIKSRQKIIIEGTLANSGLISVDNAGSERAPVGETTYLSIGKAGATLSGGGAITLSDEAHNYINSEGAGAILTNVDNTISGAGAIGGGGLGLVNETAGVIDADDSVALRLETTGGATNTGLIEATGVGGLSIISTTIANEGGVISVGAGSKVTLEGADIEGGSLAGAGEISVTGAASILDGSTQAMAITAEVVVTGGLTAIGVIDLADEFITKASITIAATLDNTGTLEAASGTLTLDAAAPTAGDSNTALLESAGGGALSIISTTIANQGGVISAGAGSKVTLDGADIEGGTLAGAGVIQVVGAGAILDGSTQAMAITGDVVVTGALTALGDIDLAGEFVTKASVTIAATLDNTGTLEAASGTLTLDGAVTGTGETLVIAGASLNCEGAVTVGGRFIAKGDATVAGALDNLDTLETAGGTVTVDGAVTGPGEAVIDGGALSFGSSVSQKVVFDGSGTLALADSQTYAGTVWKFSTAGATALDLEDIAFTGATVSYSGTTSQGVLTVTSGADVAHITLKGDYLGTTFTLSEDAGGGTIVTDKAAAPAVATIAQAIAAFAPAQAANVGVTHTLEHRAPVMLSRPGT